jgi:GGDEF domain-containing protein
MYPGPPRPRRARPIPELSLEALLERLEDVTKGWLLALIEDAPLEQAGSILTAGLVREGPRLSEGILRALVDDGELLALERGGQIGRLVFQAGELAGAETAEEAVRAIDALGAVVWSAVLPELLDLDAEADQVARLAERLALVLREVRAAAVRRYSGAEEPVGGGASAVAGGAGAVAPGPGLGPEPVAPVAPGPGPVAPEPEPVEPVAPGPGPVAPEPEPAAREPEPVAREPEPVAAGAGRLSEAGPEFAESDIPGPPLEPTHDELWVRALDEEILRSRHAGMALALLLVELDEADRIRTVESSAEEMGASFGRFAQAMRTALRRRDILACETDTRAWIVARDTMRVGAQALGGRIAGAVQAAEPWRGAPLTVTVGVAVLGEDGQDREALMDAAEQDRFAAAASGTPVLRGLRPNGEGSGPSDWAS